MRSYLGTVEKARSSSDLRLEKGRFCLFISGCPGNPRRYRCEIPQAALARVGLDCDLVDHPVVDYDAVLPRFDVFVLHRVPWDSGLQDFVEKARAAGKRILFSTDDLDFDPEVAEHMASAQAMSSFGRELYRKAMANQGKALALADRVLVATPVLGAHIEARFAGKPWTLLRNAVSDEWIRLSDDAIASGDPEGLVLGYFSGTPTHDRDFRSIATAVRDALEAVPDMRLLLVGEIEVPPELSGHRVRIEKLPLVPWRELPRLLRRAHLHLAPIEIGNPFTEAKSELKFFESGLVERPCIASSIGAFLDCIDHGRNGLLCEHPEDWRELLIEFGTGPDELRRLGRRARLDAATNYSMTSRVKSWGRVLRDEPGAG